MQDEAGMLSQERHTKERYLHAAINLCSLTLLLFDSERKGLRHVYVYAKYGDVKKPKSRHASRAEIVQAFSLSFSTYAFNCRRAQMRTELREEALASKPGLLPPRYAIARADN